jgi:hypothetical protein
MPVLSNPQHEQFALLLASGLSATKAYIKAGYSARGARQSAHALLKNPDISLRVAEVTIELSQRTMAGIVSRRVADMNAVCRSGRTVGRKLATRWTRSSVSAAGR